MHVILGAFGQVGRDVVDLLKENGESVRSLTRKKEYVNYLNTNEVMYSDYLDRDLLTKSFQGGDTVLLLCPERFNSNDVMEDAELVLENYRYALKNSSIKRAVILSSNGAQDTPGTGMMQIYHTIETLADDPSLNTEIIIVRPSYYYSNWMFVLDSVKKMSVLITYFPTNLLIPMIAPIDVSRFISEILINGSNDKIIEITGPCWYSPMDIAMFFGNQLKRQDVAPYQIPEDNWMSSLLSGGFSYASAEAFINMTKVVINRDISFTREPIYGTLSFPDYIENIE